MDEYKLLNDDVFRVLTDYIVLKNRLRLIDDHYGYSLQQETVFHTQGYPTDEDILLEMGILKNNKRDFEDYILRNIQERNQDMMYQTSSGSLISLRINEIFIPVYPNSRRGHFEYSFVF